jgi:hypothetical protein
MFEVQYYVFCYFDHGFCINKSVDMEVSRFLRLWASFKSVFGQSLQTVMAQFTYVLYNVTYVNKPLLLGLLGCIP